MCVIAGMVVVTPCPKENDCGFKCATRCFPGCNIPIMCCIEDSQSAAETLQAEIAKFKQRTASGAMPGSVPMTKAPRAVTMA